MSILHPMNIKNLVNIQLMRTFHHIQFEANRKRLLLMQGIFSVHCFHCMEKLLLLIAAVSINNYYFLLSLIIASAVIYVFKFRLRTECMK